MSIVNLLNSDDNIVINSKVAKMFGLDSAVYIAVLLNIYSRAKKKDKLINEDYIRVDRKYITSFTTLTKAEQTNIEDRLAKLNLIIRDNEKSDIIKLDIMLLLSMVSCEDVKLVKDISSVALKKEKAKETKQECVKEALKKSINCDNFELLSSLWNWVDAVYANPNGGFLTKASIELFMKSLYNYTKGNLDVAIKIVNIATIQGYKVCEWAIDIYEKEIAKRSFQNGNIKPNVVDNTAPTQKKITNSLELSNTIF